MNLPLRVDTLTLRDFRNLRSLELRPAPRLNVIAGDNGQGKTSVLEALYFVATSRSFRTQKLDELVREGAEQAVVGMRVYEGRYQREQRGLLASRSKTMALDGKKPARLSEYATRTPVVVFHPGDLLLTSGPASHRRTLLDRLALFIDPASADHRQRYQRALRERQALLDQSDRADEAGLEVFEELLAVHGAALCQSRERVVEQLSRALERAFVRMAAPGLELAVRLVSAGSSDQDRFRAKLRERRQRDRRQRAASFGPHRDELELELDGRTARRHASQGQQRVLTLALKLAELDCVREARGVHPVLLLDDVSSELDPSRTGAVYDFLRQTESQVFVTTTRPELFVTPELGKRDRIDFALRAGQLIEASSADPTPAP